MPPDAKTCSVEASVQCDAGGMLQTTPAQGSLVQAPLAQPSVQVTEFCENWHCVPEQLRVCEVTKVVASLHIAAGGTQTVVHPPSGPPP